MQFRLAITIVVLCRILMDLPNINEKFECALLNCITTNQINRTHLGSFNTDRAHLMALLVYAPQTQLKAQTKTDK